MNYHADLLMTSVKLIIALVLLTGLLAAVLYAVKKLLKNGPSGTKERLIQILDSRYLGPRKTITVVKIAETVLVLGVTSDNIQLLATFKEKQKAEE